MSSCSRSLESSPFVVRVAEVGNTAAAVGQNMLGEERGSIESMVVCVNKNGEWLGATKHCSTEAKLDWGNMLTEEMSPAMEAWAKLWAGPELPLLVKDIERSPATGKFKIM